MFRKKQSLVQINLFLMIKCINQPSLLSNVILENKHLVQIMRQTRRSKHNMRQHFQK